VAPKEWCCAGTGGGPLGAVESAEEATDLSEDVDQADRADAG
jgi:hypothetical protein